MSNTKKMVFLSLLVALGLALSIIESLIPLPIMVPGAKLGLANMVSLIALVVFGLKEGLTVAILRSITFTLATGSLSSLPYSLSGAILSILAMYLSFKYMSKIFSLIGVSIFGAMFHNIGQLTMAAIVISNPKIYSYLPIMSLISLFTGYFVGLGALLVSKNLRLTIKKVTN